MIEQAASFGESIVNRFRAYRQATAERLRPAAQARDQSFLEWAGSGGFIADREPVDFTVWRYLSQVYEAIPRQLASKDPKELESVRGTDMTIMKASQSGGSVLFLLLPIWLSLLGRYQGGYFLPTQDQALDFSSNRFIRFVRDNPGIHRLMGDPNTPHQKRVIDEGSAEMRRIMWSIIYFLYIHGTVTTESKPLDFLIFDEVQEMVAADIEKTEERVSASLLKFKGKVSTANFPDADIDYFYRRSDQREFHTRCGCAGGVVLSDEWHPRTGPECIGEGNGTTPGIPRGFFYRHRRCDKVIPDPQDGVFRAHNPLSRKIGFHWSQMLSPRITVAEMMEAWLTRVDTKNFFNRKLGLPYTDPDTQPINDDVLRAAEDKGKAQGLHWGRPKVGEYPSGVFMGVDQMGQDNHVTIGALSSQGRIRYLHFEIVQAKDPFPRVYKLMDEYRVRYACIEANPNYNQAHLFADHFNKGEGGDRARVFVANYQDLENEPLAWGDRPRDNVKHRKTEEDIKLRYAVTLDQYKVMSLTLGKWTSGLVEHPDSRLLTQEVKTDKGREQMMTCKEFWAHLKRVALVTELRDAKTPGRRDERRFRRAVRKVGADPHFAYANMLMFVAMARRFGTEFMLIPGAEENTPREEEAPEERREAEMVKASDEKPPVEMPRVAAPRPAPKAKRAASADMEQIRERLPGMFPGAATMLISEGAAVGKDEAPTCGNCVNRRADDWCKHRLFFVTKNLPACELGYQAKTDLDEGYE